MFRALLNIAGLADDHPDVCFRNVWFEIVLSMVLQMSLSLLRKGEGGEIEYGNRTRFINASLAATVLYKRLAG